MLLIYIQCCVSNDIKGSMILKGFNNTLQTVNLLNIHRTIHCFLKVILKYKKWLYGFKGACVLFVVCFLLFIITNLKCISLSRPILLKISIKTIYKIEGG